MRISDFLSESVITISIPGKEKTALIEQLLDLAFRTGKISNRDAALKALLDREKLMSTGLENGIAVPHAKTGAVKDISMALGICREGIDFQSADGKPSQLFFLLLAPENAAGPNVQVLAQIARLTNLESFRRELIEARSPAAALEIIRKAEY
ncbi:PTS sugar transporter subunit IIA [bacterium]|nr:PTS sugar transporter subunit IIA [bacterium]